MGDGRYNMATLSDVAEFRNGKGLAVEHYTTDGNYPVFGSNGKIARTNHLLNQDSVVVIGRVGAYCGSVHPAFEPSWVTDNAIIARPKPGGDVRYLYYQLLSIDLRSTAAGSAQPLVTQSGLGVLRAPYAAPPQQRAIAHILGSLDDKIELNRRTNETLEAMARALFKSWFVDFDPVRTKSEGRVPVGMDAETAKLFPSGFERSSSPIELPTTWLARAVYDLATYINGAAYRDFHFSTDGSGLPIIKIAELKAGITGQTKFTHTNPGEKYRIKTGDLLFSWSGNPDTSIDTFVWAGGEAWLNQHIFKVVTANHRQRVFVYFLLRELRPTFAEIARDKQTTGLGHVTVQDLKRLLVPVPPENVLAAFEQLAGPWLEAIHRITLESRTLTALRDTLLPKLISGEIRIKDAEKLTSSAL